MKQLNVKTVTKKYQFRHCSNSLDQEPAHAIELSCDECGDYYTYCEDRDEVSFYNSHVLKKVYNLRIWGKRIKIKLSYHGLSGPAILTFKDARETPTLWIDGNEYSPTYS